MRRGWADKVQGYKGGWGVIKMKSYLVIQLTLYPIPYTLYPVPYTLHPILQVLAIFLLPTVHGVDLLTQESKYD